MLQRILTSIRSRVALRVLIASAAVFLLVAGFVELAGEIAEGDTRTLDLEVLRALRSEDASDPLGPSWFEEMARDVTALGGNVVLGLVFACVSAYLALKRRLRTAGVLFVSIGLGFAAIYAMKLGFARPRPDLVPHLQQIYTNSFPSGHAMGSALTYLTLAAMLARVERDRRVQVFLLAVALLVTVLVGASRVYLGVHYPTDVLGGWGAGAAWAVLTWLAVDALASRGLLDESSSRSG